MFLPYLHCDLVLSGLVLSLNPKNIFLDSYRNYTNQKISEKEFLQITDNFAQTLILEVKMIRKIRKILTPLDSEFQKRCKKIYDWEDNHE